MPSPSLASPDAIWHRLCMTTLLDISESRERVLRVPVEDSHLRFERGNIEVLRGIILPIRERAPAVPCGRRYPAARFA
jgi:hypothetical protein